MMIAKFKTMRDNFRSLKPTIINDKHQLNVEKLNLFLVDSNSIRLKREFFFHFIQRNWTGSSETKPLIFIEMCNRHSLAWINLGLDYFLFERIIYDTTFCFLYFIPTVFLLLFSLLLFFRSIQFEIETFYCKFSSFSHFFYLAFAIFSPFDAFDLFFFLWSWPLSFVAFSKIHTIFWPKYKNVQLFLKQFSLRIHFQY